MKDYSQWGQAPLIKKVLDQIGTKHQFAVEFGAADGFWFSNIRGLMELGWTGLQLDGKPGWTGGGMKKPNNVKKEFLTAENINEVFAKYDVPHDFDLLTIDVDGMDYWLWKALTYEPSVVMVEYNANFDPGESVALKYQADYTFKGDWAHSASITAFEKLAAEKGYFLYTAATGSDLLFVRNDFIDKLAPETEYLKYFRELPAESFWADKGDPVAIRAQFVDV